MKRNTFTEKERWEKYWQDHKINPITNLYFEKYVKYLPQNGNLIEIGGFPGLYAGYFKKRFNYNVSILDYIIHPELIEKVEKLYSLPSNSINCIKKDFFEFVSSERYDVVCSFGFIEHFEDIRDVISRHIDLLKPKGILLITIPNLRGLNGLVQRIFDPQNLYSHNIECMKLSNINRILLSFKLHSFEIKYIGKPNIWLENSAPVNRITYKFIQILGKIIRKIPITNSSIVNPHLIIMAIK
jgi:2-polyprenyl-3-methyl-5-hydroxy-6-metoxy-1,4-benzoquinol methylase